MTKKYLVIPVLMLIGATLYFYNLGWRFDLRQFSLNNINVSFRVVMNDELKEKFPDSQSPGTLQIALYAPGREVISQKTIYLADGLKADQVFSLPLTKNPLQNFNFYKIRAQYCPKSKGECNHETDENFLGMNWFHFTLDRGIVKVGLNSHYLPAADRQCAKNDLLVAGNIDVAPSFPANKDYVLVVTEDTLHFPIPENIREKALVMVPVQAGRNVFRVLKKDSLDPNYRGYLSFQIYFCGTEYQKDYQKCVDDIMGARDARVLPLLAKKVSNVGLDGAFCGEENVSWVVVPDPVNEFIRGKAPLYQNSIPPAQRFAKLRLPLSPQVHD